MLSVLARSGHSRWSFTDFSMFDVCVLLTSWSSKEKLTYMAVSLTREVSL